MAKNPASLFYWADWENDQELRACDIAAQGLWMRMLCIAARSREYGFVLIGDQPGTPEALAPILARTVGRTTKQVLAMIRELLQMGAASLDGRGWVHCRRMVRSVEVSAKRSAAGKLGAAAAHGRRDAGELPDNLPSKPPDKPLASSRLQDFKTSDGVVGAREACMAVVREVFPKVDDDMRALPGLTSTFGTVDSWIAEGADIDRDVLPVIRGSCMRMQSAPRSWGYFTDAVAQQRTRNAAGLPPVHLPANGSAPENIDFAKFDKPPEAA